MSGRGEAITAWVGAGVVAATLAFGPGLVGGLGEEGPAPTPTPTAACPATSNDPAYLTAHLSSWLVAAYPGKTAWTYDEWYDMRFAAGHEADVEVSRLQDLPECDGLYLSTFSIVSDYTATIPHDEFISDYTEEGPAEDSDSGGGHTRCRVGFGTGGFNWSCSMST